MSTSIVQIPFVKGIETGSDPNAYNETGKLSIARNVHVSPTHKGVLSRRPGVIPASHPTGFYLDKASITSLAGEAVVTTGDGVVRLHNGTVGALSTQPSAAVLACETPMRELDRIVYGQCYLEDATTGHSCAVVYTQNNLATDYSITARMTNAGVPQDSKPLITGGTPSAISSTIFGWYDSVGVLFYVIQCDGTNIKYHSSSPVVDQRFISRTTLFAAARILDCVSDTVFPTLVLILYIDAAGQTRLAVVNKNTRVTVAASLIQAAPTSPAWGVLMPNVNGSTLHHVVLGSATADANAIRPYSVVPPAAPTAGTVLANPMFTGAAAKYAAGGTPGGGTSRILIGTRVVLTATNGGTESLLLSLSAALVLTQVKSYNEFSGGFNDGFLHVIPCGRLWHDASFEGTRFFGTVGGNSGCWQIKSDGIPYPAANVSALGGFSGLTNQGNQAIYTNGSTAKCLFPIADQGGFQIVSGVVSESHAELATIGALEQRIVEHAGFALLTGGQPRIWDGARFSPAGMPQAPDVAVAITAAGGSMAIGTYLYAFVWEYIDNAGRVQQSPPTTKTVVITVVNSLVSIRADVCSSTLDERCRQYSARYNLIVYRSTVGGTVPHRGPLTGQGGNSPGVSLVDTYADATYAPGESLVLTEQIASEIESSSVAIGITDRFVGVRDRKPDELWYTKSIAPEQSLEYNQALTFLLPAPIVGLAAQDGNIYAFAALAVYAFSPNFADGNGNGGETDAQTLSAGLGCSQSRSIVATPDGVFFCSPRGIMLCPRGGGSPVFAGEPADTETQLSATQSISGSAYNPATNEVFWVISDTGSHKILVLNLETRQWFTWVLHENQGYALAGGVAACGGVPVFCDRFVDYVFMPQSYAIAEDAGGGGGGASPIVVYVETRDFSFANFGEQQRVRSVALEVRGDTDQVSVAESTDGGASYLQAQSFASDQGNVVYQVNQQKSDRHRFAISTSDSAGDFMRFAGLSIEVVNLPKTNRVATTLKKG